MTIVKSSGVSRTHSWRSSPEPVLYVPEPDGEISALCTSFSHHHWVSFVVRGWPSDHLVPLRRCQVQTLASSLISQDSASMGANVESQLKRVRLFQVKYVTPV